MKGDLKTIFGEVLKGLRLKKGLTQQQLADYASMDRAYISELERGLLMPSVETVFRIAAVLKVKPQQIIELMNDQVRP